MALQSRKQKAELSRIIQTSLFPNEVEEIKNIKVSDTDLLKLVSERMADGYEFSLVNNTKSNGVSVLCKQTNPMALNSGQGFYSNATDIKTAFLVCLFKLDLTKDKGWEDFFSKRLVETGIS